MRLHFFNSAVIGNSKLDYSEKKLRELPVHESPSDFRSATQITCQPFLSQTPEIFVFTGISEYVPATSKDFRRFSKYFRKCPKIFRRTLNASEAIWKATNLACLERVTTQVNIKPLYEIFWKLPELNFLLIIDHVLKNNSSGFMSQAWEIVLDAWDRCLYLVRRHETHA